ncbi:MAG: hypothetical protein ACYC10_21295 [Allorhizobium sp.]
MAKNLKSVSSAKNTASGQHPAAEQRSAKPAAFATVREAIPSGPEEAKTLPEAGAIRQASDTVTGRDETYDASMKIGEDVFARFDWTLSQLAK